MLPALSLFSKSIHRVFKSGVLPDKIAIALSGGVDSVVLLDLILKYKSENNIKTEIHALTIDHRLRLNSNKEAQQVSKMLNHSILKHHIIPITATIKKNQIENDARKWRYKLFKEYCDEHSIKHIFMGHHKDDQLETFAMRLKDNSSIFGLAGMNILSTFPIPSPSPIFTIRPLLNIYKSDIYNYANINNLKWFEDPTNKDPLLTQRNALRDLLKKNPLLKKKIEILHGKVLSTVSDINNNINKIKNLIEIDVDDKLGCIFLSIPIDLLKFYHPLLFDRLLFQLSYQVSSTDKHAYRFSLFDSKYSTTVDKEGKSLTETMLSVINFWKKMQLTLSNCTIKFYHLNEKGQCKGQGIGNSNKIKIEIFKQKESRKKRETLKFKSNINYDNWIYFDNRFFFKFKTNAKENFRLQNYNNDEHKEICKPIKDSFGSLKVASEYSIPILIDNETNKFVGFPTLKYFPNDKIVQNCQFLLKPNILVPVEKPLTK